MCTSHVIEKVYELLLSKKKKKVYELIQFNIEIYFKIQVHLALDEVYIQTQQ